MWTNTANSRLNDSNTSGRERLMWGNIRDSEQFWQNLANGFITIPEYTTRGEQRISTGSRLHRLSQQPQNRYESFPDRRFQDNPCLLMAANLDMYIANAIKSLGGIEKITTHQQINSLVGSVNSDFTKFYVGKEATDSQGAIVQKPPFGGAGGFKPQFIDSIKPDEDQTHHFAGYFNAGILGKAWASTAHKWWTDFDNKGDRALGDLAYSMGTSLNKMSNETTDRTTNPRFPQKKKNDEPVKDRLKRVLGIADRVRNEICGN